MTTENGQTKVVKTSEAQLPVIDDVDELAQQDSGKGTSQKSEDKFYPLITVLQSNSPQCDQDSQAYMDGAKSGTIWMRNFDPPLVDGKEGIVVQPAKIYIEWVEWVPRDRGGGMVGRSLTKPKNARLVDPATNRWKVGENELRETRMWVVNLFRGGPIPFIIPCQGTANTFARMWNTVIDQQFEPNGVRSAAWRHFWRLTTRQRQNAKGKWHVLSFEHEHKVTDRNQFLAGRQLYEAVEAALKAGMQLTETLEPDDTDDDTETRAM
jgi:hypothetical protein